MRPTRCFRSPVQADWYRARDGAAGTALESTRETNGFSGVVRLDRRDDVEFASARGLAHRGHSVPNTLDTQFGPASATKGLTALAVVSLIEEGLLELSTTARSVLGEICR